MSQSSPTPYDPSTVADHGAPEATGQQAAPQVAAALAQIEAAARELEGRPEALLALLRSLEQLHRSIQDGPFRSSLPADRNALFQLLSEMERSGGWPYIPRLQLHTFLDLLGYGATGDSLSDGPGGRGSSAGGPGHSPRLAA